MARIEARYDRASKAEEKREADRKRYWAKQGLAQPLDRKNRAAKVTLPSISFQKVPAGTKLRTGD